MNNLKKQILRHINFKYPSYRIFLYQPIKNVVGFPAKWKDFDIVPIDMGSGLPLPTKPTFGDAGIEVELFFDRVKTPVFIRYEAVKGVEIASGVVSFIIEGFEEGPAQKIARRRLRVIDGGLN